MAAVIRDSTITTRMMRFVPQHILLAHLIVLQAITLSKHHTTHTQRTQIHIFIKKLYAIGVLS
jgi:hypothetical protein